MGIHLKIFHATRNEQLVLLDQKRGTVPLENKWEVGFCSKISFRLIIPLGTFADNGPQPICIGALNCATQTSANDVTSNTICRTGSPNVHGR
jgi:hypothetical protein